MALIDPTLDNSIGANWCTATTPYGAGDFGTPGAANACAPPEACGDPFTSIYTIQGSGPASPLDGTEVARAMGEAWLPPIWAQARSRT